MLMVRTDPVMAVALQVGGLNRNEAFDMGPQPDYTTPTELRMVRDGDKRESPSHRG